MERRDFLKLISLLAAKVFLEPAFSTAARAESYVGPVYDPEFNEHYFQFTSLEEWRKYLEPEKGALRPLIYSTDLYFGARGLGLEQQIEDFELYWDFWRMGERMYWVPAPLLWVVQIGESTVSRDKHPDGIDFKNRQGTIVGRAEKQNKGSMQIWERHFYDPAYQQALEEIRTQAGFLAETKEARYIAGLPANGDGSICEYSDWEIIPLAAFYILYHTSQYPNLSPLGAFKAVIRNDYSAWRGPSDVWHIERMMAVLQPVLNEVKLIPPQPKPQTKMGQVPMV